MATYSSLDDYEDCTFYQSLHIAGIPVYQTLKKDQGEQLHYRNLPSPNLNTTASPISKATIIGTDEPSPNGKPQFTTQFIKRAWRCMNHIAIFKKQIIKRNLCMNPSGSLHKNCMSLHGNMVALPTADYDIDPSKIMASLV